MSLPPVSTVTSLKPRSARNRATAASSAFSPARHAGEEAKVRLGRLRRHEADLDADSGGAQALGTTALHLRIGILERGDDARHARRGERIGAGRRATLVAARLEREIHGGAF